MDPGFEPPRPLGAALDEVRRRIARAADRSRRDPGSVTLVAVTKGVSVERIREALAAGQTVFGENYVQESKKKRDELGGDAAGAAWHFIGRLQRNKAKEVAGRYVLVHSLDSLPLAEALSRHAPQAVLVEVNLGGESTKGGISPAALAPLVRQVLDRTSLSVEGLMAMPPPVRGPEEARPYFRALRELRDDLSRALGRPFPLLSMGSTADFEVAVEEGATHVRVGTALFGPRPPRAPAGRGAA